MRFFQVVLSGAALINAAMAAISFTKVPTSVQAGQSVELEWQTDATGPVTILLRKGPADNLGAGQTITATGANGKFTWAVPSNLVNGNDYAFEIKQGSTNNFSGQFSLSGGTGQASSSAAASSSAPASSSAASSVSASVTVTSAASSVSGTPSASSNGTVTSATLTRSTSGTSRPTGSSTSTGGVPESTGAASTLITSPLALIFGAVAAMAYLN